MNAKTHEMIQAFDPWELARYHKALIGRLNELSEVDSMGHRGPATDPGDQPELDGILAECTAITNRYAIDESVRNFD